MTQRQPIAKESVQSGSEVVCEEPLSPSPIDHILQKLSCMELPAKEHLERYMRYKEKNYGVRLAKLQFRKLLSIIIS
jgi:hypothetical protein